MNSVAQAALLGALFESQAVTTLAWLHLLCLDFWQARLAPVSAFQLTCLSGSCQQPLAVIYGCNPVLLAMMPDLGFTSPYATTPYGLLPSDLCLKFGTEAQHCMVESQ